MEPEMYFIVNPIAAHGRLGREWPDILKALHAAGFYFTFDLTTAPGHATELARAARQRGVDTVVAVGGDGTVHEVVNGLLDEAVVAAPPDKPEATLGVIPFGTGADFVRTVGIPRDAQGAIARLRVAERRPIDVGHVQYRHDGEMRSRFFVNVMGFGFDAAIMERVNRSSKRLTGTWPFLSSLLVQLFTYENKQMTVRSGDLSLSGRVNVLAVCNGRYFGGGMKVGPPAVLDDGVLDVVLVGDLNRLEVLLNLPRIYAGTHLSHPKVKHLRVSELEVETEEEVFIEAEGELLGTAPARLRLIPHALWVLA
jgi:diacylglycerol kinase (ATP)